MKLCALISSLLACVLVCLSVCTFAFAEPSVNLAMDEEALETGALSDRFELLDKLGNSLTDEESVVIATRVGVLVSINRALNDNQVSFEGEAVGDIVNGGESSKWVNVMGASNAVISVFMTDDQASLVDDLGGYHSSGTHLKITGVYHIACPEHQGELDVHASNVEVTKVGELTEHRISPVRFEAAVVICVAALVVLGAYVLTRRYIRRRA